MDPMTASLIAAEARRVTLKFLRSYDGACDPSVRLSCPPHPTIRGYVDVCPVYTPQGPLLPGAGQGEGNR